MTSFEFFFMKFANKVFFHLKFQLHFARNHFVLQKSAYKYCYETVKKVLKCQFPTVSNPQNYLLIKLKVRSEREIKKLPAIMFMLWLSEHYRNIVLVVKNVISCVNQLKLKAIKCIR